MAEILAIQICRADHLRFALFIYKKRTTKIVKSQSSQAWPVWRVPKTKSLSRAREGFSVALFFFLGFALAVEFFELF